MLLGTLVLRYPLGFRLLPRALTRFTWCFFQPVPAGSMPEEPKKRTMPVPAGYPVAYLCCPAAISKVSRLHRASLGLRPGSAWFFQPFSAGRTP